MELKGTYIQTIFKANDSSFRVILIKVNKKTYTISGNFPNLEEGLNYKFIDILPILAYNCGTLHVVGRIGLWNICR